MRPGVVQVLGVDWGTGATDPRWTGPRHRRPGQPATRRFVSVRPSMHDDVTDPRRAFGFFTFVSGLAWLVLGRTLVRRA